MTRLSQITALVSGEKPRSQDRLNGLYHLVQRNAGLLGGLIRRYTPRDEEGEQLPPETSTVQTRVEADILPALKTALTRMFDLQFTQDSANCEASADVVIDDLVLIRDAPITYLMWLEKTLVSLRTFVGKLPTLDTADRWTWDNDLSVHRSDPVVTVRAKKVPRNHVLAEATDRHPAQVTLWHEDVPVGTWTTVKLSGAAPANLVAALDDRIAKLIDAVRVARTEANELVVTDVAAGDAVFAFILGGQVTAAG